MWFWCRSGRKGSEPDLRNLVLSPAPRQVVEGLEPEPSTLPVPLVDAKQFEENILPEIVRRWETHCFCNNLNFLKLI